MTEKPESELIQTYFYGLIKDPNLPQPTGLSMETAEAVRSLVEAEQQLIPASSLAQAKAQV